MNSLLSDGDGQAGADADAALRREGVEPLGGVLAVSSFRVHERHVRPAELQQNFHHRQHLGCGDTACREKCVSGKLATSYVGKNVSSI